MSWKTSTTPARPVGSNEETITVQARAPPLNTSDASVSTVIGNQFVENLPLNGRSFSSLIELAPGVVLTPASYYEQGQFSVNGQRTAAAMTYMHEGKQYLVVATGDTTQSSVLSFWNARRDIVPSSALSEPNRVARRAGH
jgi:hypothetical protein